MRSGLCPLSRTARRPACTRAPPMKRRTTELLLLAAGTPAVLLIFALVEANAARTFAWTDLAVPAALLGAFVLAHVAIRKLAPAADPGLLPIAYVLTGTGLAFVTRLDQELAASQVVWIFAGVAALVLTLVFVRSLEEVARYKYSVMLLGIGLLVLPALIGREINGAKLWLRLGPFSFQPGELAKICIVLFLAAYLAEEPPRRDLSLIHI
ncbi:MAG: FtsW/RodA/SpoVE family cell cycle protein [Actinobacteria bacterium]|nr:MAG: FtsW/RodA/SpoVE family cell cycle protein [Actinomycetota bacterium]